MMVFDGFRKRLRPLMIPMLHALHEYACCLKKKKPDLCAHLVQVDGKIRTERTMTARDMTGFYARCSALNLSYFLQVLEGFPQQIAQNSW